MAATYGAIGSTSIEADLLGGARYVNARTRVDIQPSLRGLGASTDDTAGCWNGIVAVRETVPPVNDAWSLLGYPDAGDGNGTPSWQAIAGASYRYSVSNSIMFATGRGASGATTRRISTR